MKFRILLYCLLLHLPSFAQSSIDPLLEKLREKMHTIYDTIDRAGAIFAVVLPDGTYGAVPVGYADQEAGIPMTAEHRMLGGSTGKIFVSAVIMQQVEKGVLDLDRPVREYLGHYDWYARVQNADQLTLRNLLRHSSGISRYVFEEQFQKDVLLDADRVWKPAELLAYVLDKDPLFAPGTDFAYSDTNYILAAMVLEEVTGKNMYKLVRKNVLKPFKLKRVSPQVDRKVKGLAVGYSGPDDPFFPGRTVKNGVYQYNLQFEWAGGGFVMNPQDLARAGKLIYEGKVFDPALLEDFFDGVDAKRLGGQWGLGVHITDTPYGKAYGHSGFFPGYITNMQYFPEKGIAIAYQTNTSDAANRALFLAMRDLVKLVMEY
ncbi:serine hydrolase domain-containing protein [Flavilitoribacter nigricans]|uniref:Beta-lactamase-related domain-containing protein n=1 Tax=Flavilitoribacter nigricans (strain ATCC 23147 / DSM 23189 / NBRC 102662 / NCIMB 1420 / SS-2) TaxID=1122177 RepID=A0A2D0NJV2_FLAN2|nr:serine hydrolase domain-containing protein [Flavilitoribacter nigricans]PHN08646.1 hypothetical protein CRP01_01670 [Flavilitoribacter nigricans DSM 23189 = NBRC 102662]